TTAMPVCPPSATQGGRAMPAFDYAALDERGRTRHGRLDADDPRDARSRLERQRLVPVRVEAASARVDRPESADRAGVFERFTAKDLALVTRQLATLVTAAPLEEALRTIAAQADRRP